MRTSSPTTVVAELYTTPAGHGRASFNPLHPELTLGALFELSPSDKLLKLLVILTERITDPILRAAHPVMILTPTFQAIMLSTCGTPVIVQSLIKLKQCRAAGCWTPGSHAIVVLHVLVQ